VQSLGSLFTDGFQRGIQAEIIAGLVATVALALIFDGALVLAGRVLMPWTRKVAAVRAPAPAEVAAA
jgi:osmoprotectant transport system permease protein